MQVILNLNEIQTKALENAMIAQVKRIEKQMQALEIKYYPKTDEHPKEWKDSDFEIYTTYWNTKTQIQKMWLDYLEQKRKARNEINP